MDKCFYLRGAFKLVAYESNELRGLHLTVSCTLVLFSLVALVAHVAEPRQQTSTRATILQT